MKIKRRVLGKTSTETSDKESWFSNIEAKPKQPVKDDGYFEGVDRIPGPNARRFGVAAADCGESPSEIPLSVADRFKMLRTPNDTSRPTEQRYRNRVRNRQTAITAMCVVCVGSRKAVTECIDCTCPLWAFRFGRNPYRGKK